MKPNSLLLLLIALSFSYQIQAQRPYVQQEVPARSYNSYQRPANGKALIGVGATFLAVGTGSIVCAAVVLPKYTSDDGTGSLILGIGGGLALLMGAVLTPIGIVIQVKKRKGSASLNIKNTSSGVGLACTF